MQLQSDIWHPVILREAGITKENMSEIAEMFATYLYKYAECFAGRRPEPFENFVSYQKGLMSDLSRKSIEPIALRVDEASDVRYLQKFMSENGWNHRKALHIYQTLLSGEVTDPDGMITLDGCDFPKKGNESPGVARQYCGATGKTDNCQATVMMGYSGSKGYGLIQGELYLPERWFEAEYKERWQRCKIPDDIEFMKKTKMAAEMLCKITKSSLFSAKWVGADSSFGSDSSFLDAIPDCYYYFADIHKDIRVFPSMPDMIVSERTIKGTKTITTKPSISPVRVDKLIASSPVQWERVQFGNGSKGPIYGREKCLRVVEIRDGKPGKEIWLYARRLQNKEIKYTLCNAPANMPIVILRKQALRRWPIEQCFKECKNDLGMDHFEGRSWLAFHRHLLFVFIAHLFLQVIRKKYVVQLPSKNDPSRKNAMRGVPISAADVPITQSLITPILTTPGAKRLFRSAILHLKNDIQTELQVIDYYLRRNAIAHESHMKTAISREKAIVEYSD